jgi:hypothetical protein
VVPTRIIVHCSATADGRTYSWAAIRAYHRSWRYQGNTITEADAKRLIAAGAKGVEPPWSEIGYHGGIEDVAGRLILSQGRAPWLVGAHCAASGRNLDSVGLCVVGCYDQQPPSPTVYGATVAVLAAWCWHYRITPDRVSGHREWDDRKTCPGLCWDMDRLRADVALMLHREPAATGPTLVL